MDKLNIETKVDGTSKLLANEFNSLVSKTNDIIDAVNTLEQNQSSGGGNTPSGGGSSSSDNSIFSFEDRSDSKKIKVAVKMTADTRLPNAEILELGKKGSNGINTTLIASKNVNLEPREGGPRSGSADGGDISLKPGDDIELCSHHRAFDKRDEVLVKVVDGDGHPVKLQIKTGDITISSEGKNETLLKNPKDGFDLTGLPLYSGDHPENETNINITTGEGKGYLKVRAKSIDLRCEEHGGIALLPKGYDGQGNMNKIKFEHGGGDGLEFGTFNTEKTSIFTDEYRFNKDGIWKMATRKQLDNSYDFEGDNSDKGNGKYRIPKDGDSGYKTNSDDESKHYSYQKQEDDFYDIINQNDPETTTEAIIKSANALNNEFVETSRSPKGNLNISAKSEYVFIPVSGGNVFGDPDVYNAMPSSLEGKEKYTSDDLALIILSTDSKVTLKKNIAKYLKENTTFSIGESFYKLHVDRGVKVSLESEEEVGLSSKYRDVVISAGDCIKCEAPEIRLNAIDSDKKGGTVNFGATENVIFLTNKLTKALNIESSGTPTKVKAMLQNNSFNFVYWDSTNSIFRIPVKDVYVSSSEDGSNAELLTPSNYADGRYVFSHINKETGYGEIPIPVDSSWFMDSVNENTHTIYKVSTKGSASRLKKTLDEVITYYGGSAESTSSLGKADRSGADLANNIEIELSSFNGSYTDGNNNTFTGQLVGPEEFVTVSECELNDIIELVNYFKTGAGQASGPWASQL